jgi:hypothetical protein
MLLLPLQCTGPLFLHEDTDTVAVALVLGCKTLTTHRVCTKCSPWTMDEHLEQFSHVEIELPRQQPVFLTEY